MRLLFVADPFFPIPPSHYGGVERIVDLAVRGAVEAGHEVALVAHPDSQVVGTRVYSLGKEARGTGAILRNMLRVRRAVRDFQPDLLHSFARLALLSTVLASKLPKIMSYQREPTSWTVREAARWAGDTLTFTGCSKSITHRGRRMGGNWESIPNGIDLNRYRFQAEVSAEAPLLFLSRVERVKGAHHAIAAARAAGRKLIIAGNHAHSGSEADYWRSDLAPCLNRNGISYIGPVDDAQKNELLGSALALLVRSNGRNRSESSLRSP